ncbi:glycine cleavage system protein R [Nocardioides halotolerans]|jgi:glycine cleavage system regulatory protein|uniref:glycine cleavage system protein R n=1 Tax=Nocardioides halotolerans TaxID=433660 RepID=UPI000417334D|nr:ACT domain-containing protein [Nocardioides halotolerans]
MATLVLTILGDDRPGLVSTVSAPVSAHGASWERSELARLAGKFAGIVVVTVAGDRVDALLADLAALEAQGLHVTAERTDEPEPLSSQSLHLDLLGADRPGIVAEISAALAEARVSIEELSTDVRDAPMAGGTLFEARAVLSAPAGSDTDALRTALEALADELMVEIRLSD